MMIGGREGGAKKGYLDVEVACSAVGHKVTIRCTRQGVVVCKHPWQKCKPRKENSDRDHCLMTAFIEDIPKQVERMKKEQKDGIMKGLLTWLAFKKRLDELGIEAPNR